MLISATAGVCLTDASRSQSPLSHLCVFLYFLSFCCGTDYRAVKSDICSCSVIDWQSASKTSLAQSATGMQVENFPITLKKKMFSPTRDAETLRSGKIRRRRCQPELRLKKRSMWACLNGKPDETSFFFLLLQMAFSISQRKI